MSHDKLTPVLGALLLAAVTFVSVFTDSPLKLLPKPTQMFSSSETLVIQAENKPSEAELAIAAEQQALVGHLSNKYNRPRELVEQIVHTSYVEADRHDLSPTLVLAIVMKESSLDPEARSGYGAVGLMQVVPRFHRSRIVAEPDPDKALRKPDENIRVGTQILAEYTKQAKGSLTTALDKFSGKARHYAKMVFSYKKELDTVRAKSSKKSA